MSPAGIAACAAGSAVLLMADLGFSTMLLAVTSLSRVALRRVDQEAGGRLPFLEEFKAIASVHRAACHAARQMCLLGAVVLAGAAAAGAGMPRPWAIAFGVGMIVGVLGIETYAARALSLREPRTAVRLSAFLMRPAYVLAWPLVVPLQALLRSWSRAVEPDRGEDEADEDAEAFVEVGEREGILEPAEGDMVRGIMDLGETLVREIMTPRTDIVAVPSTASVAEARRIALDAGHSRLPVYGDVIDNIVGVLHVRDLLRAWSEGWEGSPVTGFARPPHFVPETRSVAELLKEMRQRTHLALVVDEYGGLAGLVTLEDLLEQIVGDIRDEHDVEEAEIQPQADGSVLVAGLAHVEDVERLFDLEVGERDFDTVGGLVVDALGRVPEVGEAFSAHGLRVEVVEADARRVYKVRLRRDIAVAGEGTAR